MVRAVCLMPVVEEFCEVRTKSGIYRDWTSVAVAYSYGQKAATERQFTLTIAEPSLKSFLLIPGDRVDVALAGKLVIQEGYLIDRQVFLDASRHVVQVTGTSKAGPISNVSVDLPGGGQLRGYTLEAIAKKVLQPYGLNFRVENGPPGATMPFPNVAVRYAWFLPAAIADTESLLVFHRLGPFGDHGWHLRSSDRGCPPDREGHRPMSVIDVSESAVIEAATGQPGLSAYQIDVANGYVGSEVQWLASLRQGINFSGIGLSLLAAGSADSMRTLLGFDDPAVVAAILKALYDTLPTSPPTGSGQAWRNSGHIEFTP